MASHKYDGVIEAVRYGPNKRIEIVRAFERRQSAFSDRILLTRQKLLERLREGKRFATGTRQEFLAGTFEIGKSVRLVKANGKLFITSREDNPHYDDLDDVPIF